MVEKEKEGMNAAKGKDAEGFGREVKAEEEQRECGLARECLFAIIRSEGRIYLPSWTRRG